MSRQYKGMQEELLSKVNALEAKILELKDELERSTIAIDELRKEKAQELALKDAEIADHGPRRKAWVTNFEEGKLHPVVPFENLPLI